jgi:hypothetical protein
MSAQDHRADVSAAGDDRLTIGTVQREIRVGMPNADVVSILGAPNIVTTDDRRRESWVYDRIATETAYSTSSGGMSALILGGFIGNVSGAGAGAGAGFNRGAGAQSTNQRTLTIIIKFDEQQQVRDFAYRSSSF